MFGETLWFLNQKRGDKSLKAGESLIELHLPHHKLLGELLERRPKRRE
jgi:hypothetical protein